MKCDVTSDITQDVMISKEITYKSYKEMCSGEKKKVNLGYNDDYYVKNNSLKLETRVPVKYIHGVYSTMTLNWEVLYKFFVIHNIEPNWLNCNYTYGHYDDDLGGWTGCVGKV